MATISFLYSTSLTYQDEIVLKTGAPKDYGN